MMKWLFDRFWAFVGLLTGDNRRVLQLRPGITGPATLKYRL